MCRATGWLHRRAAFLFRSPPPEEIIVETEEEQLAREAAEAEERLLAESKEAEAAEAAEAAAAAAAAEAEAAVQPPTFRGAYGAATQSFGTSLNDAAASKAAHAQAIADLEAAKANIAVLESGLSQAAAAMLADDTVSYQNADVLEDTLVRFKADFVTKYGGPPGA